MKPTSATGLVLLTGATGYVGGRLLRALEDGGRRVRCFAREPDRLRARVSAGTELCRGDIFEPETLPPALEGVDTAYYLIHSMGSDESFESLDRRAAENFARAAADAGVRRIVYLGGLGHGDDLSSHLDSRQEVGRILRDSGVPTIELRASIIVGSGSLSFELIRALVERLPVMVTPRWVDQRAQPIAIEDVIGYLVEALEIPLDESRTFEIGGRDQVSYGDLMREYARQRGLVRRMIPVPFLTPRLSSLWLGLVTPIYARVGRQLIDGVRNSTVVQERSARDVFSVRPRGMVEAVARALANEDHEFAATRWSDALSSSGEKPHPALARHAPRIVDSRSARVPVSPTSAFAPIRRIGGETGWYAGNGLWRLRGWLDLLFGGVGLRRGRRDPEHVAVGDTLDFWRVEAYEPVALLRLRAEMKLPGRAWLQFEVSPDGEGAEIRQTAIFDPHGLAGRLYWYGLYPLHAVIFRGMLRAIADRAQSDDVDAATPAASGSGAARTRRIAAAPSSSNQISRTKIAAPRTSNIV